MIHEFACKNIRFKMPLVPEDLNRMIFYLLDKGVPLSIIQSYDMTDIFDTVGHYVADVLSDEMQPEQVLYYSDNCFGTADAISFNKNVLRIYDLKTGQTQPKPEQLLIYAALFCLEYGYNPNNIEFVMRFYKLGEILQLTPTSEEVANTVTKIVSGDKAVREFFKE